MVILVCFFQTLNEKEKLMKRLGVYLLVFGLILGVATLSFGKHHAVKVQQNDAVGKYLTDTEGKALYWFKNDEPGKSSCTGACVGNWPIYYRETVVAPEGVSQEDFGTITREDGEKQTTFRGYPLYYWVNDKEAGDTTGNGVKGVWYVVNPDDFPPK
jgi:predicted lipoprotein with Yx(FWY)xxD motif